MPISTRWYDDDHRIIALNVEGNWTWDELKQAQDEQAKLANSISHNIIVFIDMTQTNVLPKGNILALGRSSFMNLPENIVQFIVVIQSRLIEVFAGLVVQMLPKWNQRMQIVKTIEEGRQLLAEAVDNYTTGSNAG